LPDKLGANPTSCSTNCFSSVYSSFSAERNSFLTVAMTLQIQSGKGIECWTGSSASRALALRPNLQTAVQETGATDTGG
jgi:hypothetical protein